MCGALGTKNSDLQKYMEAVNPKDKINILL